MAARTGIKIIAYTDKVDLRTVKTQSSYVKSQIRKYNLGHMEAALFVNKAQTRFRLLLNVNDMGMVCCPEIDERTKYSLYLKISETMATLTGVNTIKIKMNEMIREISKKEETYSERKKRAVRRRQAA